MYLLPNTPLPARLGRLGCHCPSQASANLGRFGRRRRLSLGQIATSSVPGQGTPTLWAQMQSQNVPVQDPLQYASPQAAIAAGLDPNVTWSHWSAAVNGFASKQAALDAQLPPGVVQQLWAGGTGTKAPARRRKRGNGLRWRWTPTGLGQDDDDSIYSSAPSSPVPGTYSGSVPIAEQIPEAPNIADSVVAPLAYPSTLTPGTPVSFSAGAPGVVNAYGVTVPAAVAPSGAIVPASGFSTTGQPSLISGVSNTTLAIAAGVVALLALAAGGRAGRGR